MRANIAYTYAYDYTIFLYLSTDNLLFRRVRAKTLLARTVSEIYTRNLYFEGPRFIFQAKYPITFFEVFVVYSVPSGKYCDSMSNYAMTTLFHNSSNLSFINPLKPSG